MIVIERATFDRIADKILGALSGEKVEEVDVVLCTLYAASSRACGYPDIMIDGGPRNALDSPRLEELIRRLRKAESEP